MDRLITLEPSNVVPIRVEPGQRCSGSLTLRNVMHTMPVAFRLQPEIRGRYTIAPQSGIIFPLTTLTLTVEITYLLTADSPHCDDSFVLHSVVAPAARNPMHDSVPPEWFTNKKKQVYSESGIRVMFVGSTILARLVSNGSMDDVRDVLERSDPAWRSVDALDSDGQSLLHLAINQGRPDLVQLLLEFNPDVDSSCTRAGSSPLEAAAAVGETLIVELLLARKASLDRAGSSALGPIHLASANGHMDVLRLLLLKGSKVNAATRDGRTALHLAVAERRRDCVRLLLANGARPDARSGGDGDGDTPLHVAAGLGDEQMVRLLLRGGANKDVRNRAGKTAFDLAAENGHTRLFDALRLGDALCCAARKGEVRLIVRALDGGAVIGGRDQHGWTALHRAAFKGRVEAAQTLIERGVDLEARDDEGYTALHCAVEAGQGDVVKLLVKKGADVDARTSKGVTPLQAAEWLQYSGIARMLKEGGPPSRNKKDSNSVVSGRDVHFREIKARGTARTRSTGGVPLAVV